MSVAKWQPIVDAVGGVNALACALGVAPSTIYRWSHDKPSNVAIVAQLAVNHVCDRHKVARVFEEEA